MLKQFLMKSKTYSTHNLAINIKLIKNKIYQHNITNKICLQLGINILCENLKKININNFIIEK